VEVTVHVAHSDYPDAVSAVRRLRRRWRWIGVSLVVAIPLFVLMVWEPSGVPKKVMDALVILMVMGMASLFIALIGLEKRQKAVKEVVEKGEALKTSRMIRREYLAAVTKQNANPSLDEFFDYVKARRQMLKELQTRIITHRPRRGEGTGE
jgi:hypothetical protein